MATVRISLAIAGLLGLAIANADPKPSVNPAKSAKPASASGRMQVEEPKVSVPTTSARESKAWQKSHARGLTEEQKQAFRDRKIKMESLIAVIKEKRKAMAVAKPEERAAIARELHTLMLEKDPGPALNTVSRVAADPSSKEAVKDNDGGDGHRRPTRKEDEWRQSHKEEKRQGQSDKAKGDQD